MIRSLLIAVTIALSLAAPANAALVVPGDQRATDYANARTHRWAVPLPPQPVTLYIDECPDQQAAACSNGDAIWVDRDTWRDDAALAHELGHVFDWQTLNESDQAFFTRMLGFKHGRRWFSEKGQASPGELFADAYSACARRLHYYPGGWTKRKRVRGGAIRGSGEDTYGYRPSPKRHRRICRSIRREVVPD